MFFLSKKYKTYDDSELVKAIAKGNEAAFREILFRYQSGIYTFSFRLAGTKDVAEDIVQETFLRLFRASENMTTDSNVRAYLYRISRNLCIDYLRKKKPVLLEDIVQVCSDPTPFELLKRKEEKQQIRELINLLPERQKSAIVLRHTEELTYQEIADVMSCSVSSVESLLVRGRKELRNALKKKERVRDRSGASHRINL